MSQKSQKSNFAVDAIVELLKIMRNYVAPQLAIILILVSAAIVVGIFWSNNDISPELSAILICISVSLLLFDWYKTKILIRDVNVVTLVSCTIAFVLSISIMEKYDTNVLNLSFSVILLIFIVYTILIQFNSFRIQNETSMPVTISDVYNDCIPKEDFMISDVPINEDLFGYTDFPDYFYKVISSSNGSEGTVIGLDGKWGMGKTSMLNHVIKSKNMHFNYIIVNFNIWTRPHSKNVIIDLYDEITRELKINNEYQTIFARKRLLKCLSSSGNQYVSSIASFFNGVENDDIIDEIRLLINKELSDKRMLVVFDDVDRAPDSVVKQIVAATHGIYKFKNTTYLLLYSSSTLNKKTCESFDKIINYHVNMPVLQYDQAYEVMKICCGHLVGSELSNEIDHVLQRISRVIETPRQIVWVLNSIKEMKCNSESFVYNSEDYLSLAFISLCYPDVYKNLENNRKLIVIKNSFAYDEKDIDDIVERGMNLEKYDPRKEEKKKISMFCGGHIELYGIIKNMLVMNDRQYSIVDGYYFGYYFTKKRFIHSDIDESIMNICSNSSNIVDVIQNNKKESLPRRQYLIRGFSKRFDEIKNVRVPIVKELIKEFRYYYDWSPSDYDLLLYKLLFFDASEEECDKCLAIFDEVPEAFIVVSKLLEIDNEKGSKNSGMLKDILKKSCDFIMSNDAYDIYSEENYLPYSVWELMGVVQNNEHELTEKAKLFIRRCVGKDNDHFMRFVYDLCNSSDSKSTINGPYIELVYTREELKRKYESMNESVIDEKYRLIYNALRDYINNKPSDEK